MRPPLHDNAGEFKSIGYEHAHLSLHSSSVTLTLPRVPSMRDGRVLLEVLSRRSEVPDESPDDGMTTAHASTVRTADHNNLSLCAELVILVPTAPE